MRTTSKQTKAKRLSPADKLCKKVVETLNVVLNEMEPNRGYLVNHDLKYAIKYLLYTIKSVEHRYLIHACKYYDAWKKELGNVEKLKQSVDRNEQKFLAIPSTSEADKVMEEVKNKKLEYSNCDWDEDDDDFIYEVAYEAAGIDIEWEADREYEEKEKRRKQSKPENIKEIPMEDILSLKDSDLRAWIVILIKEVTNMQNILRAVARELPEVAGQLHDLSKDYKVYKERFDRKEEIERDKEERRKEKARKENIRRRQQENMERQQSFDAWAFGSPSPLSRIPSGYEEKMNRKW